MFESPARIGVSLLLVMLSAAPAQICGDCDGNTILTITDALTGAQIGVSLVLPTPVQQVVCDVDADLDVDVVDALVMAQAAAGLPVVLRCPDFRPVVVTCSAPDPTRGTELVAYSLTDLDSSPVDVAVEWSSDGGVSWSAASVGVGGDPTTGLAAGPSPTAYLFSWDSGVDLPGYVAAVYIRVTPSDPMGVGTECVTAAFVVDNNNAPVAAGCALVPTGSGVARFLYTAPDNSNDVPGFSIDPVTGQLTPLPGSPFDRGVAAGSLSTNTQGIMQCNGFLYVANRSPADSLSGFSVDQATGALSLLPTSPYPTPGVNATSITVDERRNLLAVSGYSANFIVLQQDPMTGALSAVGSATPVSQALGIAFHPSSGRLYVSNGWSQLQIFDVTPGGVASPIPVGGTVPSSGFPHMIQINAAGSLLFSDNLTNGVDVFDIDAMTGQLAIRPGSPFNSPTVTESLSFALDEGNDRLVLGCRCSGGHVSVFTGLASGNLAYSVDITTDPAGGQPVYVDVVGDRIFVCHEGSAVGVVDFPAGGPYAAAPGSPFTAMGSQSGVSSLWVYRVPAVGGTARFAYTLDDAEGDVLSIAAGYSTDGVTFVPATQGPGGDPIMGLVTVPGLPQPYTFEWDWQADVGGGGPMYWLRITPSDPYTAGIECSAGPFGLP